MRIASIAALAATLLLLAPAWARAEIVTLECGGDVTGTFTIDLSGGTVATYEDNRTIDLTEVEVSASTISFVENDQKTIPGTVSSSGTSSRFRIDRQTDQIERITYEYIDNKVTGESRETGQCKPVPTPHKPL